MNDLLRKIIDSPRAYLSASEIQCDVISAAKLSLERLYNEKNDALQELKALCHAIESYECGAMKEAYCNARRFIERVEDERDERQPT